MKKEFNFIFVRTAETEQNKLEEKGAPRENEVLQQMFAMANKQVE